MNATAITDPRIAGKLPLRVALSTRTLWLSRRTQRVRVESAVKAALYERHAAAIEADAAAGPVAPNGIEPAAETGRTRHSRYVRDLGIRHTDSDAYELWMPRADAVGIAV